MESASKRLYLQLCFLLMVHLVFGSLQFQNEIINHLGHADNYCFNSASIQLINFRKMSTRTTNALWDFMEQLYLRRHEDQWYHDSYYSLLFDFEKMYADCVVCRNYGLGKRHVLSKRLIRKARCVSY